MEVLSFRSRTALLSSDIQETGSYSRLPTDQPNQFGGG